MLDFRTVQPGTRVTGHLAFDRKCDTLMTGNVVSDTQYSNYIRPWNCLRNPVGTPVKPGELQKFDLQLFEKDGLPSGVRTLIEHYGRDQQLILYKFFHYTGETRHVHGYVLTKDHESGYELIGTWSEGRPKSRQVVQAAARYVSNRAGTETDIKIAASKAADEMLARLEASPVAEPLKTVLSTIAAAGLGRDGWLIWRHMGDYDKGRYRDNPLASHDLEAQIKARILDHISADDQMRLRAFILKTDREWQAVSEALQDNDIHNVQLDWRIFQQVERQVREKGWSHALDTSDRSPKDDQLSP